MFRISIAFLCCLEIVVAAAASAPRESTAKQFRVTCVTSFSGNSKRVQSTLQLVDGVALEIPAGLEAGRNSIPLPQRSLGVSGTIKPETIAPGHSASVCVFRSSADTCILDATLSETVVEEHDTKAGSLRTSTINVRHVQQVAFGEKVTFKWPSATAGVSPQEITIVVMPEGK